MLQQISRFLRKLSLDVVLSLKRDFFPHNPHYWVLPLWDSSERSLKHLLHRILKVGKELYNSVIYLSCAEQYWSVLYMYPFTGIVILMIKMIKLLHTIQNIKKISRKRWNIKLVESHVQTEATSTDTSDFIDETSKRIK